MSFSVVSHLSPPANYRFFLSFHPSLSPSPCVLALPVSLLVGSGGDCGVLGYQWGGLIKYSVVLRFDPILNASVNPERIDSGRCVAWEMRGSFFIRRDKQAKCIDCCVASVWRWHQSSRNRRRAIRTHFSLLVTWPLFPRQTDMSHRLRPYWTLSVLLMTIDQSGRAYRSTGDMYCILTRNVTSFFIVIDINKFKLMNNKNLYC